MLKSQEKAIVLGGGFTGLLAAKVLSEHFKEIIIIERDAQADVENTSARRDHTTPHYASRIARKLVTSSIFFSISSFGQRFLPHSL